MSKFCNKQINLYYNVNNLQNSQAALRLGTVNLGTRTNFSINTTEISKSFSLECLFKHLRVMRRKESRIPNHHSINDNQIIDLVLSYLTFPPLRLHYFHLAFRVLRR